MTDHSLPAKALHFAWDNSLAPQLEIEAGDSVTVETWDASGHFFSRDSTSPDVGKPRPHAGHALTGPIAVAPDLREAARDATRYLIEWLSREARISAEDAYALCSIAAELRMSQVVDMPNYTVTAFFPLRVLNR
jgi:formamidase